MPAFDSLDLTEDETRYLRKWVRRELDLRTSTPPIPPSMVDNDARIGFIRTLAKTFVKAAS